MNRREFTDQVGISACGQTRDLTRSLAAHRLGHSLRERSSN
jgi:hypothetical protein